MSTPVRVARRRPTAGTEAGDAEPSLLEELMALGAAVERARARHRRPPRRAWPRPAA